MTGGAAPGRKGSQFERDVVAYLNEHGHPHAERCYGAGRPDDVGDVDGLAQLIECKNHKRTELGAWVDAAEAKAGPNGAVVIVKRRGKPTGQAFVVQSLEQFARREAQ